MNDVQDSWLPGAFLFLFAAAFLCLLFSQLIMTVTPIDMAPTIPKGAKVIYNPAAYVNALPDLGDVVVVKTVKMDKPMVKRIMGLPGDEIQIVDGIVFRNGHLLKEKYIQNDGKSNYPRQVIPTGKYFLLNDNRSFATDSRMKNIGFVGKEDIIGRVVCFF